MSKFFLSELSLVLGSEETLIKVSYFNHIESISTLYLDCYFFQSDNELPPTSKNYIIGFILEEDSASDISSCLLSKMQFDNMIFRCLDDKADCFYYIFYSEYLDEKKFLLIKFPFFMLTPDTSILQSFIYLRPEEISFQFSYFSWLTSYHISLSEWINYSSSQKSQSLILSQELTDLKEHSSNQYPKSSKSFGLCLFCYDRRRNIVFLPCGHMAACLQCSVRKLKVEITQDHENPDSSAKCPLCKQTIQNSIEVLS
jgi:hypothetical protein